MSQRKTEIIVKSSNRSSGKPAQRKQRKTHMNQKQPGKVTRTFPPRANDREKGRNSQDVENSSRQAKKKAFLCEVEKREGRNDPPLQSYAFDCRVPAVST